MSERLSDERLAKIAGDCYFPPRVPLDLGEVPQMAAELIERRAAQAPLQEIAGHHLVILMSNLSEAIYSTSWPGGWEYTIWEAIDTEEGAQSFLDDLFASKEECIEADLQGIRRVRDLTGMWVVWGDGGPEPVTLERWAELRAREEAGR